ncbi:hypothetical protein TWF694_003551 [Orbilia ellipsospora]|uniref:Extracellular membrane protein CFEM domain-containing protein n=1 Tax=Orbilia ellipsospora TaxID=2528407 RepID=A0AAV9WYJ0_9PEZI
MCSQPNILDAYITCLTYECSDQDIQTAVGRTEEWCASFGILLQPPNSSYPSVTKTIPPMTHSAAPTPHQSSTNSGIEVKEEIWGLATKSKVIVGVLIPVGITGFLLVGCATYGGVNSYRGQASTLVAPVAATHLASDEASASRSASA